MDPTESGFVKFAAAFLNVILTIFIIEAALIHSECDSQVKLSSLLMKRQQGC